MPEIPKKASTPVRDVTAREEPWNTLQNADTEHARQDRCKPKYGETQSNQVGKGRKYE
jgi:hypothetical protein